MIKSAAIVFVFALLLFPVLAESQALTSAQNIHSELQSQITSGIHSSVEFVPEVPSVILSENESKKLYIVTTKNVTPEIQSAIENLEVKSPQIFSPVFSEVTNLVVNPAIENEKIVYHLELPVNKSIYKENEVVQPVFDLGLEQPVEFRLQDKKIVINNEQIINYSSIVSEITDSEVMPPLTNITLQSQINSEIYNFTVTPEVNSAVLKFIYREKEVLMPVYSDFRIENKKLYLIHNETVHNLKVLPPEIYSGVYSAVKKNPEISLKDLSLKIESGKPVYDLNVEEPFKLFWIIPMKISSRYVIDPDDGSIIKQERPWFTFVGAALPSWLPAEAG